MRQGYSLTGFAGMIGVSRSTITAWMDAYPEFSAACTQGKAARTSHWETAALRVADRGGGPGTAQTIIFMLKNNAPDEYADTSKHELTGKDGAPLGPTVIEIVAAKPKSER